MVFLVCFLTFIIVVLSILLMKSKSETEVWRRIANRAEDAIDFIEENR